MSTTYQPALPPNDPAQLPGFLSQEFLRIKQALEASQPYVLLQVLHAVPGKIFEGMVVEADGADWNPGSGAGCYIRRSAAWVKLG